MAKKEFKMPNCPRCKLSPKHWACALSWWKKTCKHEGRERFVRRRCALPNQARPRGRVGLRYNASLPAAQHVGGSDMSTVPKQLLSHQEYLARERRADFRSEFYGGE